MTSNTLTIMTQFTSIFTQFIAHYHPIHNPLSSNSLSINIQFITHYHPMTWHCTDTNSSYRQLPQIHHEIQKYMQSVSDTPPYTAVAHERFAIANCYSTCRAQCICVYCCVQVCLPCRGAHVRCLSWHPDGESELYDLCSALTQRQRDSVFSETFCQVLKAVELHPEHTVWFNELPVWKELCFGGRTK